MKRNILELGFELGPIIRRHGLEVDTSNAPELVVSQIHDELATRAKAYKADLKVLRALLEDMAGGTAEQIEDQTQGDAA